MARSRPNPPLVHMLVVMAAIMVPPLLAIALFTRIPEPPVRTLDPAPVVEAAAKASGYDLAVPQGLPEGWTCTRARWTPVGAAGVGGEASGGNTFALGYLSPDKTYFAVDQRDSGQASFVAAVTRKGSADGTSTVAGKSWARYVSSDGRTRSLVLSGQAVTVVSGDVGYAGLEAFASTLAFGRPPA